ncbi:hypothetical protein OIU78_026607 [Salix suchowensis]|nr:hypothetical protein OIU78_026607 [Salix suchowensis]
MPLCDIGRCKGKSLETIVVEGIGGIGKTSFAKLVYLDMKNIGPFSGVTMDANELQQELRKTLSGKKLLLVLDEVWKADDQHAQWNFFVTALESAAQGSKIIITAREMSLAVTSVLPCVKPFNLKEISDDDCWALFSKHAFCGEGSQARLLSDKNFRSKVLGRCGGVPLRAIMLGNHLRCKQDTYWEEIASRWDLQPVIIPVTMKLSLGDGDSRISPKARHIWCPTIRGYEDLKNLVGDGSHIFRTILPTSNESFWGDVNDEKLKAFNSLRVLSLSNITRLPVVLGCGLKHLRHLEISGESIKSLPPALSGINGNGKGGYKWVSVEKAQRREKELLRKGLVVNGDKDGIMWEEDKDKDVAGLISGWCWLKKEDEGKSLLLPSVVVPCLLEFPIYEGKRCNQPSEFETLLEDMGMPNLTMVRS